MCKSGLGSRLRRSLNLALGAQGMEIKKTIFISLASFLVGVVGTVLLGSIYMARAFQITEAIRLPAEIARAGSMIKYLDEGKYDAARSLQVLNLRCNISELENRYRHNPNFTSAEALARTKEHYSQYTQGIGCEQ